MRKLKQTIKAWAIGIGAFLSLCLIRDEIAGCIVLLALMGFCLATIAKEAVK